MQNPFNLINLKWSSLDVGSTLRRYWLAFCFIIVFVCVALALVGTLERNPRLDLFPWQLMLLGSLCGWLTAMAMELLYTKLLSSKLRTVIPFLVAVSVVGISYLVSPTRSAVRLEAATTAVSLFAVVQLLLLPPFFSFGETKNPWLFLTKFHLTILSVGLFALILYLGLAGALATITALFELNLEGVWYGYLAVIVFAGFFFSLLTLRMDHLREDGAYPKFLLLFAKFVVAPLVIIFITIIAAYTLRLVIQGDLPSNQTIWLMLMLYGGVTYLNFVLLPLRQNQGQKAKLFARTSLGISLLLLPLYFYAIGLRVWEYGFTVERLLVLQIGIIVGGILTYLLLAPKPRFLWPLVFTTVFTTLAVLTPWVNIFEIAKTDQQNRLISQLRQAEVLVDNILIKDRLNQTTGNALEFQLVYLLENHGWNGIRTWEPLPEILQGKLNAHGFVNQGENVYEITRLVLDYITTGDGNTANNYYSYNVTAVNSLKNIAGFNKLIDLRITRSENTTTALIVENGLNINLDNQMYRIDISDDLKMLAASGAKFANLEPSQLTFEKTVTGVKFKLLLDSVTFRINDSVVEISSLTGLILIAD